MGHTSEIGSVIRAKDISCDIEQEIKIGRQSIFLFDLMQAVARDMSRDPVVLFLMFIDMIDGIDRNVR
jgi:hypothetical protein